MNTDFNPEEFENDPQFDFDEDMNLSEIPEVGIAEKNEEIKVKVTGFFEDKETKSYIREKNGFTFALMILEPEDQNILDINAFVRYPNKNMKKKDYNLAASGLKKIAKCFDISESEFSFSKLIGQTGWIKVGIKQDQNGTDVNCVNEYVPYNED